MVDKVNRDQIAILLDGVDVWNSWRAKNPRRGIDLTHADLSRMVLPEIDFYGADLRGANLSGADLTLAMLRSADLSFANLNGTQLFDSDLTVTNLTGADLREANFQRAILRRTYLHGANLDRCQMIATLLGDLDLSRVEGLETVRHIGPSTVSIGTVIESQGKIPRVFLLGAGVPESFVDYIPSLIGAMQPIQFYSCFISYSSANEDFARRLYADLQAANVRCWFAPEDLKIGDRFRQRIEDAIQVYDKLLVVLSEKSVASDWVETEVEGAMEREHREPDRGDALFPIRLDEAVMDTRQAWASDLRRKRHIGDFTRWKEHDAYKAAFDRLLRDLKASAV